MAPSSQYFSFGGPSMAPSPFGAPSQPSLNRRTSSSNPRAFAPKKPSALANTYVASSSSLPEDDSMDSARSGDDEDGAADVCYLEPYAYSKKTKGKWKQSGRTMMAAVSPVGGEIAGWIAKQPAKDPNKSLTLPDSRLSASDRAIYFAAGSMLSDPVMALYTESYTLFSSLQRIFASSMRLPNGGPWEKQSLEALIGPPGAETVGHMRRLGMMYLDELSRLREANDVDSGIRSHFTAVYHVFQLAVLLYLPADGRGEGLVGEELLDWVNDVDPAPDNTQGQDIMQVKEPWTHPSFWPYIIRCILRGFHLPASSFLRTLHSHSHPPISKLGVLLSAHLSLFPRSHDTNTYPLDHQFLAAHKKWLSRFRAELATFLAGRPKGAWLDTGDPQDPPTGDWDEAEEDLRVVIELMEGKAERVLEQAADWREAVGAWGILVDVGMRRDDLPEVTARVLKKIPTDSTLLDDTVQASLCAGDIVQALTSCHDLDTWLAAHLSDFFDKLAMIPDDEDRFDMSLRDYFLLEYAELLQSNPKHAALWRIVADYLAAAGEEGRSRLREHIVRVGLGWDDAKGKSRDQAQGQGGAVEDEMQVENADEEAEGDQRLRRFAEIREACIELKLDEEWKIVSRVLADRLVRKGEVGIAATMYLQAEDADGLSRVAETILDAYVHRGEHEFLSLVDTVPASLINDAPLALKDVDENAFATSGGPLAVSVFASRLVFVSEFRDYLLFLNQGAKDEAATRLVNLLSSGVSPAHFWAIILAETVPLLEDAEILFTSNDSFELLRVLEQVSANSAYAAEEYLGQLSLLLARREGKVDGMNLARRKMEEIRLALARNLARALVAGFDSPF